MSSPPLPRASPDTGVRPASAASWLLVLAFWSAVGIPAAWGVYRTAVNAAPLFRHATAAAPASKP